MIEENYTHPSVSPFIVVKEFKVYPDGCLSCLMGDNAIPIYKLIKPYDFSSICEHIEPEVTE